MAGMRGGIDPRQMKKAMRSMGITNESIPGVTEVIIRTNEKEIVITNATVNVMTMKGQKSFQIDGIDMERPLGSDSAPAVAAFPEDDIELVISQTNCDREKAIAALEECGGLPAEAILKIMTE
ncbi:MAG: nascent polypeptide-associated complex protein [Candidatus Methanomethylophilaceae archaeon]|jgi:nascent polypeptide-associated complex subunit alpha|nr:nascent polypeptide-associated complex protein [Candidatus Methanomethylophilaceae archaeon]